MEREGRLPKVNVRMTQTSQVMQGGPSVDAHGNRDFLNGYFNKLVAKDHQDFSNNPRVVTADRLVKQIRSARKMFKLLKFIDTYKSFRKHFKSFSFQ